MSIMKETKARVESNILDVEQKAFFAEVVRADRPVLVSFYAAWCKQSLEMLSVVEKVSGELGESTRVVRVDITKNEELAKRFGVTRIPTQLLFVDGAVEDKAFGTVSPETLLSMAGAATTEVSDVNFGRRVLQSDVPVMALFWDAWCAQSVKLRSSLDELGPRMQSKCRVVSVQASAATRTCARLGIERLPIVVMFREGQAVDMIGGLPSRKSLLEMVEARG